MVAESDRISKLMLVEVEIHILTRDYLEAPFSRDRSIALLALCGIEFFTSSSFCFRPSSFSLRTSLTKVCTLA